MGLSARTISKPNPRTRIDDIMSRLDKADREWLDDKLTARTGSRFTYSARAIAAELADESNASGADLRIAPSTITEWRRKHQ